MARHYTLGSLFSDIANAIRLKTGDSATIKADDFDTAINNITTDPSGPCTATNDTILAGYNAYAGGVLRTGSIQSVGHPAPTGSVSASGATVTYNISHTQDNGYNAGGTTWFNGSKTISNGARTITAYSNGNVHVNFGTAGYMSGSNNGYVQYATQAAKTITPSTSIQQAIAANTLATGNINVAAMPSGTTTLTAYANGYVYANRTAGYQAASNPSVHYATQTAKTVTPSTSAQTAIAANTLATGAVTVAAVANASAGNIKHGVTIAGVIGTMVPSFYNHYWSGTVTPNKSWNLKVYNKSNPQEYKNLRADTSPYVYTGAIRFGPLSFNPTHVECYYSTNLDESYENRTSSFSRHATYCLYSFEWNALESNLWRKVSLLMTGSNERSLEYDWAYIFNRYANNNSATLAFYNNFGFYNRLPWVIFDTNTNYVYIKGFSSGISSNKEYDSYWSYRPTTEYVVRAWD